MLGYAGLFVGYAFSELFISDTGWKGFAEALGAVVVAIAAGVIGGGAVGCLLGLLVRRQPAAARTAALLATMGTVWALGWLWLDLPGSGANAEAVVAGMALTFLVAMPPLARYLALRSRDTK